MHYYKFNIADYRKDTAHLCAIEHYIYRTLIDWYYLNEKKIPKETQTVMRWLRLETENKAKVENVLNDFFIECDDGWKHTRIDAEIAEYNAKSKVNANNGKLGGRPKKTQTVSRKKQSESEKKPNHKPLTINHNNKYSDDSYEVARFLDMKIRSLMPEAKTNPSGWVADIDKAIRIDGRTKVLLISCIEWIYSDEGKFWRPNILSGKKLREKFDTMYAQAISKSESTSNKNDDLDKVKL